MAFRPFGEVSFDSEVGVFDTPPHRRHRLLVCQTHHSSAQVSARVTVRGRPCKRGPHQARTRVFSDVTQLDLTDFAGQKRDLRTMEPVAGENRPLGEAIKRERGPLGEPVLIGRAINEGRASTIGQARIGRTCIGQAIKRGWGEPSNEVGRASTKGP